MDITFIGAGQMGLPMVHRLLESGRRVTVYARRPEVRDACAAAGATASADLQAAVRGADAVVLCLYSDAQVREVALGPEGILAVAEPGAVLVNHTTGNPATTHSLAEQAAVRDVRVVDAPVSGSAEDIAAGRVTVLLGGEPTDVERARAIVGAYGDPVLAIGPLGSAQAVKLLNNVLFAAQVQLAGEVERIADGLGVDMAKAAAAIQRSSGASYAMGLVEAMGSARTLAEAAGHFLHKDVTTVRAVAGDLGLDLGELGHVNEVGPLTFTSRD